MNKPRVRVLTASKPLRIVTVRNDCDTYSKTHKQL